MAGKLIFIYNADSGLFNTVTDIAHKIFSPRLSEGDRKGDEKMPLPEIGYFIEPGAEETMGGDL